jgi:hypothetical protein
MGRGRRLLRIESAFRTRRGWSARRTSSLPPISGDRGRHAILGVGADHEELTEPLMD